MPGPDTNPFDQFDAAPAAPALGVMTVGTPRPPKPPAPNLPQGWEIGPDGKARPVAGLPSAFTDPKAAGGKTTYRPLSAAEIKQAGLPAGAYQVGSDGKIDKLADEPKADADPAIAQSIKDLGLDEWLGNIATARKLIKGGFSTGIIGKIDGVFPGSDRNDFLGTLQGIQGATILEKLTALREQSKNGSSGMGSLTEQEGERLANSIAALNPNMSAEQLLKNLDVVERHALSLKAIGSGEDPSDPEVQKRYGIPALGTLPIAAPGQGGGEPPAGGDPNPFTNGEGGPTGPTLTPSGGETRSVIDPRQQALGAKIAALMSKGADRNTIMGFAVGASPKLRSDPAFRAWMDQALAYRAKHPGAKFAVDPSFYTTDVPLSTQEKIGNTVAQSAPGAAAMNAADTVSAGHLGDIVGDKEGVNRALQVSQSQHPGASLAGMVGGGASAGAALEGILGLTGIGGAAQPLIADTIYGTTAGARPDENGNYLGNMAKGAILGLLGGQVGKGVSKTTGAIVNGVTDPTVSYVARELPGKLTIGQALSQSGRLGAGVKKVEDSLSGIPVVGDSINARRTEGLQAMNSKAFDRALEPIKGTVAGQFGEQAVSDAQDQVSAAFQKALAGKSASVDRQFAVQATKAKMALDTLPDSVRPDVEKLIDSAVKDYFDKSGHLTGENMQPLLQELGAIKRSYQGAPGGHRIGKVVDQFTDSVESMFQRQAPEVMPQYNAAKQAFKRVSTLESAVLAAKNTSKDGNAVFTSAQLGQADRANTVKFGGKHAAAAGKGDFHEFQRNMQEVLPSKVPDSGTAGRLAIYEGLKGLGAGAGIGGTLGYAAGDPQGGAEAGAGTALTLGALLAMAYGKTGQKALTAAALKSGKVRDAVGSALSRSSRAIGHGSAAAAALGTSRD